MNTPRNIKLLGVILIIVLGFPVSLLAQITFERTYGGPFRDEGYSVQQTPDGGHIIVGSTNSFGAGRYDVYLIKTDAEGDTLWARKYGGRNWDWGNSVQQTSDGGYIIAGETWSFGAGNRDVYLIKTDADGLTEVEEEYPNRVPSSFYLAQNYPNSFNSTTTISYSIPKTANVNLSIYNIRGRLVRRLLIGTATAGAHSIQWDGKDNRGVEVNSGIYFYRLEADNFVQTKRMIFLR